MKEERKRWSEFAKRVIACKQEYKCAKCANMLPPSWCADHIIPLREGGSNDTSNCQILCPNCHAQKTAFENIYHALHNKERFTKKSKYWDPDYSVFFEQCRYNIKRHKINAD